MYTCQKGTLLEITYRGSDVSYKHMRLSFLYSVNEILVKILMRNSFLKLFLILGSSLRFFLFLALSVIVFYRTFLVDGQMGNSYVKLF